MFEFPDRNLGANDEGADEETKVPPSDNMPAAQNADENELVNTRDMIDRVNARQT